ncbi:MAG: 23S rRNA (uracil-5-)-methyltransferase RumA [Deltaproteobacteria bacterium RBG_16_48_10]|nr:MAG: 23S rRNA (uracil-5-)-methyltransferase RumA [Deltaproteobacteria bacterium RBG_16_48_10]
MGKKAQVTIASMAFKGYGVTRVDNQVIFIPYTVTGDEASIEIVEQKRNYSMGRIKQLIAPSPWRVNPQCPYFQTCGGCQWQHIERIKQAEIKRDILQEVLQRLGGQKEIPPITVIPSPKSYGYRVRVQLKIEGKSLGYYRERSHHIVDIQLCPIAHPLVNQMILLLREELSILSGFEEVEINTSPEEEKGVLLLHPLSFSQGMESFAKELLQAHSILKGIVISRKGRFISWGNPFLTFTISLNREGKKRPLRLRASPESFYQVNLEQNEALIQAVLGFSETKEEDRVVDLYAGIGNFTLPLTLDAKEVFGIEENEKAVEDARFNAQRNGITRCHMMRGRVEEILKNYNQKRPDLVILDPPRTGAKEGVNLITELKPKRIIYVSCDPTTLSRDLPLFAQRGYTLDRLSLVDMFPQTYHMEVVALLKSLY